MDWVKENGLAIATGVAIGYAISVVLKPAPKKNGMITEDELNNKPIRFKYKSAPVKKQSPISSDDPIFEKDAVIKATYGKPVPNNAIVESDYLDRFMKDTFLHYGMTEMDASISSWQYGSRT